MSAKLQACVINYNDVIKSLFGKQYALERQLPIALQLVTFDVEKANSIKGKSLPKNLDATIENFQSALSDDEQNDPRFRYRVAFVPMIAKKVSKCDQAIEFVKQDSPEAATITQLLIKEKEKNKYMMKHILKSLDDSGYKNFNSHDHTILSKQLDAKNPSKGFGGYAAEHWYWYDAWIEKIKSELDGGWKRPMK